MKRQGFDTQPSHYRGDLLRSYAQVVFSLLHRAAGGGCAGAGAVAEADDGEQTTLEFRRKDRME